MSAYSHNNSNCCHFTNPNFPFFILLSEMTSKCLKLKWQFHSHRKVVSLQKFEHFNTISVVKRSIDHGELLLICFLTVFDIHLPVLFKCVRKFVPGESENKLQTD